MTPEERGRAIYGAWNGDDDLSSQIATGIRAAIREENEACARIWDDLPLADYTPKEIAAAIRERIK